MADEKKTTEEGQVVQNNRHVLRAMLLGGGDEPVLDESNLLDPFVGLYGSEGNVLQPPYDPYQMSVLPEKSDVLTEILDAICVNIEGQGHSLVPWDDDDDDLGSVEAQAEKQIAKDFLASIASDGIEDLREQGRTDLELTGNWYDELLRETATTRAKRARSL